MPSAQNMHAHNQHFQARMFQQSYLAGFNNVSHDYTVVQAPTAAEDTVQCSDVTGLNVNNIASDRVDNSNFVGQSFTQLLNSTLDTSGL